MKATPIFNMKITLDEKQKINEAIKKVEVIVTASGNAEDLGYFNFHKKRYTRMAETIISKCQPHSLVLDIGSLYLHSSLLLTFLGFRVHSMDVSAFWELEFVKQRASLYQLSTIIENNLEKLDSCSNNTDQYDIVLFTEILEHITFNPINFWKTIYSILKNEGHIYISTPNSLTIYNIARTLKNMLFFKGIGLDLNSIFGMVTYGHHWKEYSTFEIKNYFSNLSDGFSIEFKKYHYKVYPKNSLRSYLRAAFISISNILPFFQDEIEAFITVNKAIEWKAKSPQY